METKRTGLLLEEAALNGFIETECSVVAANLEFDLAENFLKGLGAERATKCTMETEIDASESDDL